MDVMEYSKFFFALAFVLGMIWALAWVAKRSGLDKRLRGVTGNNGRLAVTDVLYLDPRRKITLVRADDREYLILIAGDTAQLIDTVEAKKHEQTLT